MNLPLINNRNMKKSQTKNLSTSAPPQQFGLGIQIFKIQSSKVVDDDRNKQRKMIKNIQNPNFTKQNVFTTKKVNVLPSISAQKKLKGYDNQDIVKQRRVTQEKKKYTDGSQTGKPAQKKKVFQKKSIQTHQNMKPGQKQLIFKQKQPQIIQVHYIKSLNQLKELDDQIDEQKKQNIKQMKRLRKLNQTQDVSQDLKRLNKIKQSTMLVIDQILFTQKIERYEQEEQYQQFSIQGYVKNNNQFLFYDVPKNIQV